VHNHYFKYDAENRLTEWQLTYGFFIQQDHFYKYDGGMNILKDSLIQYNAGDGKIDIINVSSIEYDGMGRVIKETIVNKFNSSGILNPTRRPTFTYDSRGNLAVAGWKSSSYDNKINPLRQNKVFQFVMRNYSMNNAAVQLKYNSIGLPLSMKPTNDNFFNGTETTKVEYDCL
jgi:hypothetical protein